MLNPFAPKYVEAVKYYSSLYQELRESEGEECVPYEIYPASPGLLIACEEVNGSSIFWLTEGEPDKWPLMLMTVDWQFERREQTLLSFLVEMFRDLPECVLWTKEWAEENLPGMEFHPKERVGLA